MPIDYSNPRGWLWDSCRDLGLLYRANAGMISLILVGGAAGALNLKSERTYSCLILYVAVLSILVKA